MPFTKVVALRSLAIRYLSVLGFISLCLPVVAMATCFGDQNAKHRYSVYIVPQYPSSEIYASWAPILERVGIATNQCFELVVPGSIPDFEKAVISGKADYAYMNPYHEVIAYYAKKYNPIVADGSKMLSGIVVVKTNSPIRTLSDLRDTSVAFPSPNSFGASLLIRATLSKAGIPIHAEYVKSHTNVYRAVIMGDYPAGGGIQASFDHEPPEVKERLRVLYATGGYRSHPIAVNPRVPAPDVSAFTNAFLKLKEDPIGQKWLTGIQIPDPIRVSYLKDYQTLETLGLGRFVVIDAN